MRTLDCRDAEPLVSAWLDAELGARERASVGAHLQTCARCRRTADGLRATSALLAAAPVRRLPPEVRARVLGPRDENGLPERPARHALPAGARPAGGVLARVVAAAAVLVLALATTALLVGGSGAGSGGATGPDQQVAVPVEVFVVDHLVQTRNGTMPVAAPVLFESGR